MTYARARLAVSLIGLLVWALTHAVAAQPGQPLGMLKVSVQVDGLSCPFCAYGLEKKLRNLDNVASLEIQVSEGRAVLTPEPSTSLDLAAIEQGVRDGGFTPRDLTVTARGRLSERQGTLALELTDDTVLVLTEGGQTDELLTLTSGSAVWVEGQVVLEQADGPAGHVYRLTVDSFEPL